MAFTDRLFLVKYVPVLHANQGNRHWVAVSSPFIARFWSKFLLSPGLNSLKTATPLVLNKEYISPIYIPPIRYRYSTDGSPIHYRHTPVTILADTRSTLDLFSIDNRPILNRYSIDTRPILFRYSADTRSTLYRHSADMSTDTRPIYRSTPPIRHKIRIFFV